MKSSQRIIHTGRTGKVVTAGVRKTATARGAAGSLRDAGDRQIHEFERTFTVRYEW